LLVAGWWLLWVLLRVDRLLLRAARLLRVCGLVAGRWLRLPEGRRADRRRREKKKGTRQKSTQKHGLYLDFR
jgi:hypothetical protein